jgi:hypothetical protein
METSERSDSYRILSGLAGLIVALLLVGAVSRTPMRHVIQVTPATIAAVFVARGGRAARYAALPIFLFWLLIMVAIWLFLMKVATFVSGTFTSAEIVLTIVVGLSSLWGIVAVLRRPRTQSVPAIIYFVVFAALQWVGLWMSLQPEFARR